MADLMNDNRGGLQRVEHPFERGIQLLDESEVWVPAGPVLRQIEARHTDQVDARKVVSRAQRAADREMRRVQLLQKVRLRWPRLYRAVGETDRLPHAVGDREQASELVMWEPPKTYSPVRFPFDEATETAKSLGDSRIGIPGGLRQPVGSYRLPVGEPMVQQDLENHERGVATGRPRVLRSALRRNSLR